MTRANARELAVHLIYGREFTGEEPQTVVSTRLDKEYYSKLSDENEVYSERPSKAQLNYIDNVVSGVANRQEDLNAEIQKFSIGWDIRRISRLARCVMQLAIFEILYVEDVPPVLRFPRRSALPRSTMATIPAPSSMAFWALSPGVSMLPEPRMPNERHRHRYQQLHHLHRLV